MKWTAGHIETGKFGGGAPVEPVFLFAALGELDPQDGVLGRKTDLPSVPRPND